MLFVGHAGYRAMLVAYRKIIDAAGLSSSTADALLAIGRVGVLDMPTLYERWCLLQAVSVLVDGLGFTVSDGDSLHRAAAKLAAAAKPGSEPIVLRFEHASAPVSAELSYQPQLDGLRPDFTLLLEMHPPRSGLSTSPLRRTLVLDCKCKTYEAESDKLLGADIMQMEAKYSGKGTRRVFIVHPSCGAIRIPRTPQRWNSGSCYGGSRLFGWEPRTPNHAHGAVLLRPDGDRGAEALDNLRRLIAMELEALSLRSGESCNFGYDDPLENSKSVPIRGPLAICIACGGTTIEWQQQETKTGTKWHGTCSTCGHFVVVTHCCECKHPLVKHGPYWTYHDIDVLNVYHLRCPRCGAWYDPNATR
ncbi:MAG: nuclease domain-containing protein [Armatimonadetes bacterium]|nr:nuclease domain-containing protein [Armatimonadota bacterium]